MRELLRQALDVIKLSIGNDGGAIYCEDSDDIEYTICCRSTSHQHKKDCWVVQAKSTIQAIEKELAKPEQGNCNPNPEAPHGFDRDASHEEDRYVCECEGWAPDSPDDLRRYATEVLDDLVNDELINERQEKRLRAAIKLSEQEPTSDTVKHYCDRISELEAELDSLKMLLNVQRRWINLEDYELNTLSPLAIQEKLRYFNASPEEIAKNELR